MKFFPALSPSVLGLGFRPASVGAGSAAVVNSENAKMVTEANKATATIVFGFAVFISLSP